MTKQTWKEFFHRGLIFGGFGPIIMGIIYAVAEKSAADFSLSGMEVLIATISIYLLAFIQAGTSVFHQIETWSVPKAAFSQLGVLYLTYVACYLLNSWIPFRLSVVLLFTAIFVVGYFAIWLAVYLSVKAVSRRMNAKIEQDTR